MIQVILRAVNVVLGPAEYIYLPALVEPVPNQMAKTIGAFIEFKHLFRRSVLTESTIVKTEAAISDYRV